VAALNHSNICAIYDVDECDGTMFIEMEYIEGGTVRKKITFPDQRRFSLWCEERTIEIPAASSKLR